MSISSSSNHNNNNNNGGARRLFHKLKVLIIGGGLGGLALANSLLEHPDMIEFWIFERDSHEGGFRPQGYRIGLDAEGIAALAACGISETRLRASGLDAESLSEIKIGDAQTLKVLLGFPAFGGGVVSRWLLHETLREKVVDHIVYSKAFASFESRPSGVTAIFQDGSRVEADMIIGADGIASKVRKQWVPSLQLLDSGVTGLAGNVTLKELQDAGTQIPRILQISEHSLVRLLGPGAYTWLFLRYTDEKTSQPNLIWVLNHHVESPERDYNPDGPPEAWLNFAKQVSRDAHPELAALVASTPPHCLLKPRHQCHLSSQAVAANPFAAAAAAHPRIALLGDAAHAMTTHRGQGANTAFMDAQDLSRAIFDIARERYNGATDFNINHLMTYHATCSRRGATRIAGSLSSTTSMHTRSKIFRLIQVLIMRCVNFFLMIYFFLKRILKRP